MRELTADRLRAIMNYDLTTGVFTWLCRKGGTACKGATAGTIEINGYLRIGIDRHIYRAHRLAWLYVHGVWPTGEIDHIDGDKANNRIENLRDVSRMTNQQNMRGPHKRGNSGFLGVSRHASTGKWRARICINGKNKSLGLYASKEDASSAYINAKRNFHQGSTL